ncbi:3'(2'),5'-bisphosphate nucleotidase CysQ [Actinosynnema sp. NPDC020468]|uniref:3'(2'),5'-bisphosphate nucleotidase CysQ n=1 Tax=Actinosynnema sp. NPDC020468 TaxID=3154488 RepID=UPI00340F8ECC
MPCYRGSPRESDHRLAHDLAAEAGRRLLRLRADGASAEVGDRLSDEFLVGALASRRPGDAVLSEESADRADRSRADRVWIVDPLDGSREFGEPGREDWAVHVALWADGVLAAGAVAVPAKGVVRSTLPSRPAPPAPDRPVLLVSRSRPPAFLDELTARWPALVRPMGSAGAKTASVLAGEATAYLHAGGQYEWDSAAPVAVAVAGGLRVRRLDGSAPRYNRPDPWLPDVVICHPAHADALWSAVDSVLARA